MTREGISLAPDPAVLISSLFALIPIPVAVVDATGRIVLSNSAFADIFQGLQNVDAVPQHELELPGRGTYDLEILPLTDEGLKIVYASDVSNEVQLRKHVVSLEKMASIGRLVSGVAHELTNPLAGILGYAELASRSGLDPKTQRMMDVILGQAERAAKIVENFLCLAAKADPTRVAFNVNEAIRTWVELRECNEHAEDATFTLDLSEDLPRATGDPNQFEQVLLNLVVNAEDAIAGIARSPGSIHIRTFAEGTHIHITVADNGSGIHPRDMARVFDPFYTTKDKSHTGLGLSICSEIIKDHGGELYAWSAYENGSTFTIELPVIEGEDEVARTERLFESDALRGKSVLVIDDEVQITQLMSDVLSRHGATIDSANSGTEALVQIRRNSYDVMICDQRMPGLSMLRLYKLVRSLNPERHQRFLFVTGDDVNAKSKRFFQQAGVQFLRKPFRIQDLVESVEMLINRNQPPGF